MLARFVLIKNIAKNRKIEYTVMVCSYLVKIVR